MAFQLSVDVVHDAAAAGDAMLSISTGAVHATMPTTAALRTS
jgi:hypothetical protein